MGVFDGLANVAKVAAEARAAAKVAKELELARKATPTVDMQRRALLGAGKELPKSAPVTATPSVATTKPVAPLEALAQKPMSRRDFLKTATRAAANTAIRSAVPDVAGLIDLGTEVSNVPASVVRVAKPAPPLNWDAVLDSIGTHTLPNHKLDPYTALDMYTKIREAGKEAGLSRNAFFGHRQTLKDFQHLEREAEHYDVTDDLQDTGYELASHANDILAKMPPAQAIKAMESAGMDTAPATLAKQMKSNAMQHEDIHGFLQEHHPEYTAEDVESVLHAND